MADARVLLVLASFLLVACPEERSAPDPVPGTTVAAMNPVRDLAVAKPKPTGCDPAPVWVGLDACQSADGHLYATARYDVSAKKTRLARAVVAARARARVGTLGRVTVKDDRMSIRDAEVPFVHRCNDTWVGLAKLQVKAPATIPACPADLLKTKPTPPAGCPDWAARIGWKDGDVYYGVGEVPLTKNLALARSAGQARALTSARAVYGSIVGVDGKSATIVNTAPFSIDTTETATCGDALVVRVGAKPAPVSR